MSNPTAHENAASTATATAPSQPPLKRKAEFDREEHKDRARIYDIRRRVNAAKLVDKIRADAPDYTLPFSNMHDVWRRLIVYHTVNRAPRPVDPNDPASELPEKVQQLDKQYQQLREEFTRSRNKAGAKVTAVW